MVDVVKTVLYKYVIFNDNREILNFVFYELFVKIVNVSVSQGGGRGKVERVVSKRLSQAS